MAKAIGCCRMLSHCNYTTRIAEILIQHTKEITKKSKMRKQCEELYTAEQTEQYAERQAERMERMSKYSLDEGN